MNRQDIYSFKTVCELDEWAKKNGLSADTEVSLHRITLLTHELSPDTGHKGVNKHSTCTLCNKTFKQKQHLQRHLRTVHGDQSAQVCPICHCEFNRKDNFERHLKSHEKAVMKRKREPGNDENRPPKQARISSNVRSKSDEHVKEGTLERGTCIWGTQDKSLLPGKKFCQTCGEQGRECNWCHRPLPERFYSKKTDICDRCLNRRDAWVNRNQQGGGISALDGSVEMQTLEPDPGNLWDILQFFVDNQLNIKNILMDRLTHVKGMKWFMTLFVKFVKYNENNEAVYAEPTFRSISLTCTNASEIKQQTAEAFQHIHNAYQNFERDRSGWTIDKILRLEVSTAEYVPLTGSSYIPLPPTIQKKKAVLNIKNNDQKCFNWSIIAALHPVSRTDNPDRVLNYVQYEHLLKTDGLDFPTALSQIPAFEKKNNISINVFGLEHNEVYPLQITVYRDMSHHVNLLLFSKGETRHFCLIRSLSRLLGDRTAHNGSAHYCNYCLHGFTTKTLLEEHAPYCSPHGPQKLSFPKNEEQQWVKFNNINKQLKVPFFIYADFESFIKPISSCSPDPQQSSTTRYQKHEPSGFCYMGKCTNDELSKTAHVYRGTNVMDHFFECMVKEEQNICDILSNVKPMKLTQEEEKSFENATLCGICQRELGTDRVRDHDHLTGKFRSACHSHCNFQYQFRQGKRSQSSKFYIPVIFHNLRGYDLHLMMESAGKMKNKRLSCIPNNMEKYISFSLDNLRFIDSLQFLNASLETLVTNLAEEGSQNFPNLSKHFPETNKLTLLLRKGVYCYDYVTSPETFKENVLPSQDSFYNKLYGYKVSDDDYSHAQIVWKTFEMNNFGQYHDLYLMTDVLLLADVFEHFRQMCISFYHLDPAHYFSSPNLAWDAMLKMTGVELQLIDDIDMYLMIEKGLRGGISMISKKYAKANNHKVSDFDPTKPKTWLTYLDMNNLYGTSMCESLPEKNLYWLNEEEIEKLDISKVADDAETGYILECDLDYPQHLHHTHNDYPMAAESLQVTKDMLSPHTRKLRKSLKIKSVASNKLVPNLKPKVKYTLHYRNLKYYLSHGLQLTKVHRVIGFTQSPWLKTYIDFNTEKRKYATNSFKKDFFKLMNNSVFGKTMENMRKRVNVELINTPKRLKKVCAKPNFQSFKIFNEDLVAVNLKKVNIVLHRPIYAGFSILEVSKVFMYQFHYDYMKVKYGNRAELLFTDTDSLSYKVETDDWYQDMLDDRDLYDTSNYDKDHILYSKDNCKVLGKMKDECAGIVMEEFIGLRPKMYSIKYGGQEKRTAKGVTKSVIDRQLKHEAYRNCLINHCSMHHNMNMIRSYAHQLYSITVNKVSLSPYDDKRHFLDNGIDSLAYGHFEIKTPTSMES